MTPKDFAYGKDKYGRDFAFQGVCDELLQVVKKLPRDPLYDVILIDEAQDFPRSFFELSYAALPTTKRLVWAYDELQNLGSYAMEPPAELFGRDENGNPLVELRNIEGQPHQDVILPVCYRNTPWALTEAHALGFGIYRNEGLVQLFDDPTLWADVGYEVINGRLSPDSPVTLGRGQEYTPDFFVKLLDPNDAVTCHSFEDSTQQIEWVANEIKRNLTKDELEVGDILVVFPDPLTVPKRAAPLINKLQTLGIDAHIAGVTSSRDEFFSNQSVTISGVFRAKGNEAPMVYLLDSQYCFAGPELIRRRNTLFTSITRSRAWVRLCGWGSQMDRLKEEFDEVKANDFRLEFVVPTIEQLTTLRRIHRDMTPDERRKITKTEDKLKELARVLESGDLEMEHLSKELRNRLKRLLSEPED